MPLGFLVGMCWAMLFSVEATWNSREDKQKIVRVWLFTRRGNGGGSLCDDGNVASFFPGNGEAHAELDTASFFRWSMKTWRLTSSVRIGAPASCCDRKAKQQLKKKNKKWSSNSKIFFIWKTDLTITLITFLSPRWSHISSEVPFEPHILTTCCRLQLKALHSIWKLRINAIFGFLIFYSYFAHSTYS